MPLWGAAVQHPQPVPHASPSFGAVPPPALPAGHDFLWLPCCSPNNLPSLP
jgi:hypothetical protein